MDGFEIIESLAPPLAHQREAALPRVVWREVRREAPAADEVVHVAWRTSPERVCDGVRQLAVVVWARTKLLERTLADQEPAGSPLLACLARIDAAIAVTCERLDALEDVLPAPAE